MTQNIYLGIDLGSSRTSIASSTGVRETIWSYVGYPKDHVAKKTIGGREMIFGKEAVNHRMAVDLLRPLAQGTIKGKSKKDTAEVKKAVKDLLHFVVQQVQIPHESTIFAVIGAPAQASVEGKAALLEAAEGCIDSAIVCSEPFAVAYGLDFLNDTLVIDIGAGTTDLCRVHGTMPAVEDGRTHHVAGDAIDKTLADLIKKKHSEADFSINMIRAHKERYASVSDSMEKALVQFPVKGKPTEFDISDLLKEACHTIVEPTVQALQDLIATYDPEFQEKMRQNILLGGGGSQIKGLGKAIEENLRDFGGGKVTTVEEPLYAGANGALKIALDMPEDSWAKFRKAAVAK